MLVKSSFKTYFSNTKNAPSTDISRWGKKTLSFEEALDQLKGSTGSSTECVAFRTLGRCRKQIKLIDPHHVFIARLNDGNITEEKTVVCLIDLMLCPEHWAQTVFHYSLYLNWLNSHGLKPDTQYYENIVVDYEAARAIEDRTTCLTEDTSVEADAEVVDTPSVSSLQKAERATTPSNERSNNPSIVNSTGSVDIPIIVELESKTETDQVAPWTQPASANISTTDNDTVPERSDNDHSSDSRAPADDSRMPVGNTDSEDTGAVPNLQSYASLGFGVAKLEIMHRENLRCIAMLTDGWRCSELIPGRSVEKAQDILTSTTTFDKDQLENIARAVLCSGHGICLPGMYADTWSVFTMQRLPAEEALLRFQFTFEDSQLQETLERARSASELHKPASLPPSFGSNQIEKFDFSFCSVLPFRESGKSNLPVTSGRFPLSNVIARNAYDPIGEMQPKPCSFSPGTTLEISLPVPVSSLPNGKQNADNEDIALAPLIRVQNPLPKKIVLIQIPHQIRSVPFIRVRLPPGSSGVLSERKKISTLFNHQKSPDKDTAEQHNGIENGKSVGFGCNSTSIRQLTSNLKRKLTPHNLDLPTSRLSSDTDLASIITAPTYPGGYVNIFKSQRLGLVKIGTRVTITDAINPLPSYCRLGTLREIATIARYRCKFPERAERLAQMELSAFRWIPECKECKELSAEDLHEHQCWFEVAADLAVKSAEMWAKFVDQAYSDSGRMLPEWEEAVKVLPQPSGWGRKEEVPYLQQEKEASLIQEKLKAWMVEWMAKIGQHGLINGSVGS
jgi:hypothetical protein